MNRRFASFATSLTLIFILLAGALYAQSPQARPPAWDQKAVNWKIAGLTATLAATSVLDVHSTQRAIRLGHREVNPIFGQNPTVQRMVLTKAAISAPAVGLSFLLANKWKRPKTAYAVLLAGIGVNTAFAIRNYNLERRTSLASAGR